MLKSKRYFRSRIIKLLIQLGDVILDSKLGKKLESNYHQSTKGSIMRNTHLDRSNELVGEYFDNFTKWANDRQIIQNGNILAQGLKLVSEVGELADNLAKGRCTKDDIGDCCVVLNNLAQMQGLSLEECLAQAWEDIKDRKGTMNIHGVFIKDGDV